MEEFAGTHEQLAALAGGGPGGGGLGGGLGGLAALPGGLAGGLGSTKEQLLLARDPLLSMSGSALVSRQTNVTPGLRYRNLGKSGLRVSNVGLGECSLITSVVRFKKFKCSSVKTFFLIVWRNKWVFSL